MKVLPWLNAVGVIALAVLCVWQWDINRRTNLLAVSLDKTRQEQARKIADQEKSIKGYMADLDDFRQRLMRSDEALAKAELDIRKVSAERNRAAAARDQALAERDELIKELKQSKETLAKWMTAFDKQDAALKKAIAEIQTLGKERNDAIISFNDLANKYNALVKGPAKSETK
jgi:septal ring factor EnvC (AmiA/AmiB activator)